jgi:DNA-binding response OmpR family regulator
MKRILIVEDEAHLAKGLRFNLEAEGYAAEIADRGERALELLKTKDRFDLIVLDVMLPGKDGFDVASELRAAGDYTPILMLTARGRPEDVLKGFEAGTDDYLPKPFDLSILIARIGGLLRRAEWTANGKTKPEPEQVFTFGDKSFDFQRLQLRAGKETHQLTLMEAELLRYLIQHEGRPVSRKDILADVWNLHADTDTRAIDSFIVRLRRYIEREPTQPRHLLTVRGVGYQFEANPKA